MTDDDRSERARVFARIAPAILEFRAERPDATFHIEDLRQYVRAQVPGIAPDSPGRILRELRLARLINYVVINRRQSLYQFRPLEPPPARPWGKTTLFDWWDKEDER